MAYSAPRFFRVLEGTRWLAVGVDNSTLKAFMIDLAKGLIDFIDVKLESGQVVRFKRPLRLNRID